MENGSLGKYLFYVFGLFAVLAIASIAMIPSTMVYKLRLFDGVGLESGFVEFVRFVIVLATPISVVVVGLIRVFAVSDESHERWLTASMVLEILSMVSEILASMCNGSTLLSFIGQGVFLCLAIVSIFLAVSFSITKSGWFRLAIAENKKALLWGDEINQLYKERIRSDESKEKMQEMIDAQITQKTRNGSPELAPMRSLGATVTDDYEYKRMRDMVLQIVASLPNQQPPTNRK